MPPRIHIFTLYTPPTAADDALRLLEECWGYYSAARHPSQTIAGDKARPAER
ncbi:MAG: hypothetical protein AAGF30_04490 [Pseudomonadota bacterium]